SMRWRFCWWRMPTDKIQRTPLRNPDRREFLGAIATVGAMTTLSGTLSATPEGKTSTSSNPPRWPKLQGSPVLDSLHPVIEHSRYVHTHVDKITEVAQ